MPSQIDPTKPVDGVPAVKADLRASLQAAKDEIETLQTGKADAGHSHVLAEVTDAGALAGKDTVGSGDLATGSLDGKPINMQDQLLIRPQLKDFSEISTTPGISAGNLILDLETGNVFEVMLTEDITSLLLVNPPAAGNAGSATLIVRQDAAGDRTLAWPSSVLWSGGPPPLVTAGAHAIDVYTLLTTDGGGTWYGFPGGQDFS